MLATSAWPAWAQQWIQIPVCGGALPANVNPSAATIAVNPSGQLCVLTGAITVTVPTPTVSIATPLSINIPQVGAVVSGSYADGALTSIGSIADSVYTSVGATGDVIQLLKGIFANVITPVAVTGSFTASQTGNNIALVASQQIASPSTYGVAPVGSVLGVNAFVTNQPTVVLSGSPVSVGIAAGSSPINVTGNFATTTPSPQAMNLEQVQNVNIASPSTYGVAPVGSVQGVNAFVTSLPATPLGVAIAGPTPLNVTVGGIISPQGVTIAGPSPLQITLPASPLSVGIAAGSSPINVTGNFTSASPQATNLIQLQNVLIASPSTYGLAPVGSVQGVNAFVTNNVNVTPPTPLQITLPATPISVGVANSNINVTTTPGVSPQNVTIGTSPVTVSIASSPVNVTGSLSVTPASPQNTNLVQIQGVTVASASTYGAAPVGSVQGVNAFVTNNVNVTPPTPLNVTLGTSPVSVAISTVSSPVNVTGSLSVTPASPQNTNLVQIQGVTVASASTYGVAPVGSVQGVNAFVTSLPATPLGVAIAGPSPLQITLPASPISAGITNNVAVTPPTPLQITLPASPISVGIAGPTPLNVTLNASPLNVTQVGQSGQNFNLVQWQGINIASASTYGVAPVGSVGAVNAFVTNNVNVTPPTPLQVTLPASPISVAIASPISVGLATGMNLVQIEGTNIASPSTYGVAPVGSVGGFNAFMTNANPNGLATMANSQPVVVASDQTPVSVNIAAASSPQTVVLLPTMSASPLNVTAPTAVTVNLLGGQNFGTNVSTNGNVIAWTATSSFVVTNAALALGATPGIVGIHQFNGAQCSPSAQGIATPQVAFLEIFDATPHATGSDVTLGTTIPKIVLPIATSASTPSMNPFIIGPPGVDFTKGISVAFTTTAKGPTAVGVNLVCSFVYN